MASWSRGAPRNPEALCTVPTVSSHTQCWNAAGLVSTCNLPRFFQNQLCRVDECILGCFPPVEISPNPKFVHRRKKKPGNLQVGWLKSPKGGRTKKNRSSWWSLECFQWTLCTLRSIKNPENKKLSSWTTKTHQQWSKWSKHNRRFVGCVRNMGLHYPFYTGVLQQTTIKKSRFLMNQDSILHISNVGFVSIAHLSYIFFMFTSNDSWELMMWQTPIPEKWLP